jgi:hypothetical protein
MIPFQSKEDSSGWKLLYTHGWFVKEIMICLAPCNGHQQGKICFLKPCVSAWSGFTTISQHSYKQIHNYLAKAYPWYGKLHQSSICFPFHLSS